MHCAGLLELQWLKGEAAEKFVKHVAVFASELRGITLIAKFSQHHSNSAWQQHRLYKPQINCRRYEPREGNVIAVQLDKSPQSVAVILLISLRTK